MDDQDILSKDSKKKTYALDFKASGESFTG